MGGKAEQSGLSEDDSQRVGGSLRRPLSRAGGGERERGEHGRGREYLKGRIAWDGLGAWR